jgi:hypothetical protein
MQNVATVRVLTPPEIVGPRIKDLRVEAFIDKFIVELRQTKNTGGHASYRVTYDFSTHQDQGGTPGYIYSMPAPNIPSEIITYTLPSSQGTSDTTTLPPK